MQLLQENQQINVFINDWTLEQAAEEQAEGKAAWHIPERTYLLDGTAPKDTL